MNMLLDDRDGMRTGRLREAPGECRAEGFAILPSSPCVSPLPFLDRPFWEQTPSWRSGARSSLGNAVSMDVTVGVNEVPGGEGWIARQMQGRLQPIPWQLWASESLAGAQDLGLYVLPWRDLGCRLSQGRGHDRGKVPERCPAVCQ